MTDNPLITIESISIANFTCYQARLRLNVFYEVVQILAANTSFLGFDTQFFENFSKTKDRNSLEQNLRLSFERKAEEYSEEPFDYEDEEDLGADYPQDSPEMDADVRMKVNFVINFIIRRVRQ